MDVDFRQIVLAAATRADVRDAVARLYIDVQREIDARRPACVMSGRCCHFEAFGHRLFVTTLELAAFAHDLSRLAPVLAANGDPAGCPFQVGKLCGVHSVRPFGCRMFFCDPTAADWQNQAYERFHTRLKALHDDLDVQYRYVEWRRALDMLGPLASAPAHPSRPVSEIAPKTPAR